MKITFLGTSSMMPTKERNTFSILFSYKSNNFLIDCGEGTQRQLRYIGFSPAKINKIFITHWHGDHILGLPGLIETLYASNYLQELSIYGPLGSKKFLNNILKIYERQSKLKIKVFEVKEPGAIFEDNELIVSANYLKHSTLCLGYSIKEKDRRKINLVYTKKFGLIKHPLLGKLQKGLKIKFNGKEITPEKGTFLIKGKKVSIITDSLFCKEAVNLCKDSDLLICESTFSEDLKSNAQEFKHMTTKDAANLAKESNSKKLILTHISQRYKFEDSKLLENESKKVFKNSTIAKDFLSIEIK